MTKSELHGRALELAMALNDANAEIARLTARVRQLEGEVPAAPEPDLMRGLSPDARLALYPDSLTDDAVRQFMALRGPMSVPQVLEDARAFLATFLCEHARYFGTNALNGRQIWVVPVKNNGDYAFEFEDHRLALSEFCWDGRA
jgi:hypothetical protein